MPVPVICIGNLVVGGAGKTPVTIAIAQYIKENGKYVHILSRGYKGNVTSPTLVNPAHHQASEVGDEPLLLARTTQTWVFKDRLASARAAIYNGAKVLIMDDGFQNHSIHKDLSLLVVDSRQVFGNERVIPAGPLREEIEDGLARADAVIIIGKKQVLRNFKIPVINASLKCTNASPKRVLAFTGLGFPEKFYQTLANEGYDVAHTESFPDHHPYKIKEIDRLVKWAKDIDARLITTEKDILRIPDKYHHFIDVLKVELVFDDISQLRTVMHKISQ